MGWWVLLNRTMGVLLFRLLPHVLLYHGHRPLTPWQMSKYKPWSLVRLSRPSRAQPPAVLFLTQTFCTVSDQPCLFPCAPQKQGVMSLLLNVSSPQPALELCLGPQDSSSCVPTLVESSSVNPFARGKRGKFDLIF